ncbi:MAG: type IV toxin-antitoxin system AbiEi family antitoxin domain-containing protein [Acidimicrobiia bacterium]
MKERDVALYALAARRHAIVTTSELRDLGFDGSAVQRRMRAGMLIRFRKGVYAVAPLMSDETIFYATAASFPLGAVARSTAAHMLGLPVKPNGRRFVVPHGRAAAIDGMILHETRSLPADHVVQLRDLPVTSGARTLCDITPFVWKEKMRHLVEVALTTGVTTTELLMAMIDERQRRGVKGIVDFRRTVSGMLDDQPYPESLLEVDVSSGFAEVDLVGLSRQYRPEWYDGIRGTVDWHDDLGGDTIIEADGRGFRQVTRLTTMIDGVTVELRLTGFWSFGLAHVSSGGPGCGCCSR